MTTGNTIATHVRDFAFIKLFRALGWDNFVQSPTVLDADGATYTLTPVMQKRGLQVFECSPAPGGGIPPLGTRKKISRKLLPIAREHLIIYVDARRHTQKWEWNVYEKGKPQTPYGHTYERGNDPTALVQKLERLNITLDEDDRISIVDVSGRVSQAFKATENVTKKFYNQYEREYKQFVTRIAGIADETDRGQYATLMLDRLMFVYFIQSKGFLDGKRDYLRVKFDEMREHYGHDQFYTFYRRFLLRLFHEALATKRNERPDGLDTLLGDIPYLNGGLFEQHRIELGNPDIQIPDDAFAQILGFFDAWTWHLDTRSGKKGDEINPDVLGYIFEKFINQKQMGAYYTKEDITEYIGKNTIIPWLFDAAKEADAVPFAPHGEVWAHLREQPDRYLYDAVRYGVIDAEGDIIPLPSEVEAGVADVSKRAGWNRPAPQPFALPTETWREHVARRQRCLALRERLKNGEITQINDCITENLNIRQFAEDVIANTESPNLLDAFYAALNRVTVLDPTCGSGAFLFAALNILAPLYQACITGMEQYADERPDSHSGRAFKKVLDEIEAHPNTAYFITKRIIIQNLYGVDIMPDATEICKLRLFLTLAAHLRDADRGSIEPLPDIDFNIRAGNTLVGFTNDMAVEQATQRRGQMRLDLEGGIMDRVRAKATVISTFMRRYRDVQTGAAPWQADHKRQLQRMLAELRDELDRYLAADYGIVAGDMLPLEYDARFKAWCDSHQPFHWYSEFYEIMERGGFDVIIGNPPWKEYATVRQDYTVRGYLTETCGNLHGMCTERDVSILSREGWLSLIVQLPLTNSSRMVSVRNLLRQSSGWLSIVPFDDRPGKLFEGLQHCRSTIFIAHKTDITTPATLVTSHYQRWPSETRANLFATLGYTERRDASLHSEQFPKFDTRTEAIIFDRVKIIANSRVGLQASSSNTDSFVFYQESAQYWLKATVGLPYYAKNGVVGAPAHGRFLYFADEKAAHAISALLNSSIFYMYFISFGDCFHLSDKLVSYFPILTELICDPVLIALNIKLMADLKSNAQQTVIRTSSGDVITYDEFASAKSKRIIDEIDRVLAKHYGFTDEELDYIINFDIKYRMGADAADGEGV